MFDEALVWVGEIGANDYACIVFERASMCFMEGENEGERRQT